jgi:NDP-sugar pyrophosphorylase family protein
MIFAAGLGTRLRSLTNHTPKALVKIGDRTILEIAVRKIKDAGFGKIVINAHHFAEQIFDFVQNNDFEIDMEISHEKDLLLDTGGGIFYARDKIGSKMPFLVHNVDIVSNADLVRLYSSHREENLATLLVSRRETGRYLLFNEENQLVGWQNSKTGEIRTPFKNLNIEKCNSLAFNGIHVISPKIFHLMKDYQTPFSIIDFYLSICNREKIIAYQQPDLEIFDVGTEEKLKKAAQYLALQPKIE